MEYSFPNSGYENVNNQFMIGENLLVAPVLEKGCVSQKIAIPKGKWKGFDGKTYKGPKYYTFSIGLADLPYFERIE